MYLFLASQHDQTAADLAKEQSNQDISKLLENPQKAREVSLFFKTKVGTLLLLVTGRTTFN